MHTAFISVIIGIVGGIILLVVNNTKPLPEKLKFKSDHDLDNSNKQDQDSHQNQKNQDQNVRKRNKDGQFDPSQNSIQNNKNNSQQSTVIAELSEKEKEEQAEKERKEIEQARERQERFFSKLNDKDRELLKEYVSNASNKLKGNKDQEPESTNWFKYLIELFLLLSVLILMYSFYTLKTDRPMTPKEIYRILKSYFNMNQND